MERNACGCKAGINAERGLGKETRVVLPIVGSRECIFTMEAALAYMISNDSFYDLEKMLLNLRVNKRPVHPFAAL